MIIQISNYHTLWYTRLVIVHIKTEGVPYGMAGKDVQNGVTILSPANDCF